MLNLNKFLLFAFLPLIGSDVSSLFKVLCNLGGEDDDVWERLNGRLCSCNGIIVYTIHPPFDIITFFCWRPFKTIKRGKGKQRLSLLSLSELTFGARGVNSSAFVDAVVPLHFFSLSLGTLNSGSLYLV